MGAPSGRLRWDETDLLQAAVPPFLDAPQKPTKTASSTAVEHVKWRVLQGQTATDTVSAQDTLFLNTVDLQPKVPGDVLLSHFYEHSISVRDTHYLSDSSFDETTISLDDSNAIESVASGDSHSNDTCFEFRGEIYDLRDIPNAAYLRSIIPQTMSVTLVVAITGINPPRRVTARYSNQQFDILELVVGDETKTGFGVTFWLPVENTRRMKTDSERDDSYRKKLSGLRPRDIVLIRHVGLSFFQDRVYGQSLRKTMTNVDLLHRRPLDATDPGGIYSARTINAAKRENRLLHKVQAVHDWSMSFVGMKTQDRGDIAGPVLPPDTQ
ncbi:hypothetical protein PISL3812_01984 [Talaromyces islandicus]|uniref:Uncharacterized protein n=1 Tax=Talaromyces islandicus TaxID=28573 RepID=A0A0U1LNL5_TALIS|nr:hypothetical protein PISL3812_01984 [Talaromyces islandicus]